MLFSPWMRTFGIGFLLVLLALELSGQERLVKEEEFEQRKQEVESLPKTPELKRALSFAREEGLSPKRIYPNGRMVAIRRISATGMPEYLGTHNVNAAATLSTDKVLPGAGSGLDLSGEGIVVGVWDGALIRATHQEFGDRVREMNNDGLSGHATHVGGTIGASGVNENARGMAPEALIETYNWTSDIQEMNAAGGKGLLISNHSYGYLVGFEYDSDEERWEWWGDLDISDEEDYKFGYYHPDARSYDQVAYSNPNYLIVKSAGNGRGDGPSGGGEHVVFKNGEWVTSTDERQVNGGADGYDCLAPVSTAKNIMVVGSVGDLPGGVVNPSDPRISGFSAFGPTDDGRIKPDIVGNGEGLLSSYSGSDDDYRSSWGTSMSAPNVSGSMALLQELHFRNYGSYMRSASLRGLILHTASDAGNPGPDYIYGWGVMNTLAAARVVDNTSYDQILENELVDQSETRIRLFGEGLESIRVTLCWTDLPGQVPVPGLNPTDRILVNDLDLRVIRQVDGMEFRPFVLDPVQPSRDATTGDNQLDNVEQVLVERPSSGFYEIIVSHKDALQTGAQEFSLIVSGLSDEFFASGTDTLSSKNGAFLLSSAGEYLPDMDASWLILPENGEAPSLSFSFFETEADQDVLRIYDGSDTTAPLLAAFSGTLAQADTLVEASGSSMLVHFTSNERVQEAGFQAQYCTVAPEGEFVVEGQAFPCAGSEEIYVVSGQEGTAYAWNPPVGWNLLESGLKHVRLEIGTGSGLLEVIPSNRCGTAPSGFLELLAREAAPLLTGFVGDTLLCAGVTGHLEVDSIPGASYQWALPDDWLGSSEGPSIFFIPSLRQGSVKVSAANACSRGDTLEIPILVKTPPAFPQIFSVDDKICQFSTAQFYIQAEQGAWYTWDVEPDWEITGPADADTVLVEVGASSNYMLVTASNECGNTPANRFFLTSELPDTPLLSTKGSAYEGLPEVRVQNATSFSRIQWYLDGQRIESAEATRESYVAYIPGIYSVEVENRDGCLLVQDPAAGIDVRDASHRFAAYSGGGGMLVIHNTLEESVQMTLYDTEAKVHMIRTVAPGRNEIRTGRRGAFVVFIQGPGQVQHTTALVL